MKVFCLATIATASILPERLGQGVIVNDSIIDEEFMTEVLAAPEGRAFKDDCVNSLSAYHRNAVEACDALVLNNKYRQNHAANNFVVPSKTTCEGAQKWAQHLADKSLAQGKPILEHSPSSERPGEGENIAWSSWGGSTMSSAVTMFQSEDVNWNFSSATCKKDKVYGHFTQNVWQSTTSACYAKAVNSLGTWTVGRYNPPGNYIGQEAKNVDSRGPLDGNYVGSN
ncbi:Oidioi.mRNA.OKI2018_I69.chr2.g4064.t1.cds [Oikopleura dioica]|uniref:Oidioi.mRNA.OKI2018_I69.chr2.g4064.t1.cds n=1 Tax=Oikopleura dioica TaxID=34765 RepID=A0ABN7SVT7_OIKDI|nr:Oidioi.mRNA.OKI2018_I69.chr2.g4064.t1.cds [Oikopleura dioica]